MIAGRLFCAALMGLMALTWGVGMAGAQGVADRCLAVAQAPSPIHMA